jgi:hypothetical protein
MPLLGAAIMGKFAQIGGKFADPSQNVHSLQAIDAGIRNPGNDFKKALIMRTIQEVGGGGMDIYDVQKVQDKGLFGSEQGGKILQSVLQSGRLGQGKTGLMNLKNLFPQLDYDTVERLYENKDKLDYSGMTGRQIEDQFSGSFVSRGISNTSGFSQMQARVDDRLSSFGETLFNKLAPLLEGLITGLEKFLTIVEKLMAGDFSGAMGDVMNIFKDVGKYIFDLLGNLGTTIMNSVGLGEGGFVGKGLSNAIEGTGNFLTGEGFTYKTDKQEEEEVKKQAEFKKNEKLKIIRETTKTLPDGSINPNYNQNTVDKLERIKQQEKLNQSIYKDVIIPKEELLLKPLDPNKPIGKETGSIFDVQERMLKILEQQLEYMKNDGIIKPEIVYNTEKLG